MSFLSSFLSGLAAFLKYAPIVLAAVKEVELAVGTGNGADKKALVLAAVLAAVHAGENVPVAQVQTIARVIDLIVGVLNSSGVLGKTTSAVAVPAVE